jgi:hypothetical protein
MTLFLTQLVSSQLVSPQAHVGAGDPLVSVVARVLNAPLRELYAELWRAGLVEIVD